jgi:Zn-dependent protease
MNPLLLGIAQALIVLISISVHEASHAYAAYKMGDPTAMHLGRVTLNPLKHIDLWGTIIIPLILILSRVGFVVGWAKPVPINPNNFEDRKKGEIIVSLAGPLSNLLLATVVGLLMRFLFSAQIGNNILFNLLFLIFAINILLAFFNLIPIPPLDGSHVLENMLSYKAKEVYRRIAPFSFIIILILINVISPLFFLILRFFAKIIIGISL